MLGNSSSNWVTPAQTALLIVSYSCAVSIWVSNSSSNWLTPAQNALLIVSYSCAMSIWVSNSSSNWVTPLKMRCSLWVTHNEQWAMVEKTWHDPLRAYVAHTANIRDFHSSLSVAIFSTSFQVFPIVLISASIVSRDRPRFLLPLSGVHLSAVLVMLSQSFRITCPSHPLLYYCDDVPWTVFW